MQLARGAVVLEAADDGLVGEDGAPSAAQITLRAFLDALAFLEPSEFAAETAWPSAADGVTVAVVSATLISWLVARVMLLVTPALAWTVRSPPSTGSPP